MPSETTQPATVPNAEPTASPAANEAPLDNKPRLIVRIGVIGLSDTVSSDSFAPLLLRVEEVLREIHTQVPTLPDAPHSPSDWIYNAMGCVFGAADRWKLDPHGGNPGCDRVFTDKCPKISLLVERRTDEPAACPVEAFAAARNQPGSGCQVEYEVIRLIDQAPGTAGSDQLALGTDTTGTTHFWERAVSEHLRHHSDLLLAIDPEESSVGCSGLCPQIEAALRQSIPVVLVQRGREVPSVNFLTEVSHLRMIQGLKANNITVWETSLPTYLNYLLQFPEQAGHSGDHPHSSPKLRYQPWQAYQVFRSGKPLKKIWVGVLWEWFDRLMKPEPPCSQQPNKPAAPPEDPKKDPYEVPRVRASSSGLSGIYGNAHRGGIILSYALAAIAVLLAILGGMVHYRQSYPVVEFAFLKDSPQGVSTALAALAGSLLILMAWCHAAAAWNGQVEWERKQKPADGTGDGPLPPKKSRLATVRFIGLSSAIAGTGAAVTLAGALLNHNPWGLTEWLSSHWTLTTQVLTVGHWWVQVPVVGLLILLQQRRRRETPGLGNTPLGIVLLPHLLGAVALTVTVIGVIIDANLARLPEWSASIQGKLHSFGLLFAVGEVVSIALMAALHFSSTIDGWNGAYTDTRILAEALRMMKLLARLGVHTPLPRLPYYLRKGNNASNPDRVWSIWYFKALVRMQDLRRDFRSLKDSHAELKKLIDDQIKYHEKTAAKFVFIHHGIEKVTKGLFGVVGLLALAHWVEVWKHLSVPGLFETCFVICIGGPALIAAMHGFASQMEVDRLQIRSSSMARLLEERRTAVDAIDLSSPDEVKTAWILAAEALTTTEMLMDEVAGWSLLYRNTGIHAG
jgi:hypothetical protein